MCLMSNPGPGRKIAAAAPAHPAHPCGGQSPHASTGWVGHSPCAPGHTPRHAPGHAPAQVCAPTRSRAHNQGTHPGRTHIAQKSCGVAHPGPGMHPHRFVLPPAARRVLGHAPVQACEPDCGCCSPSLVQLYTLQVMQPQPCPALHPGSIN